MSSSFFFGGPSVPLVCCDWLAGKGPLFPLPAVQTSLPVVPSFVLIQLVRLSFSFSSPSNPPLSQLRDSYPPPKMQSPPFLSDAPMEGDPPCDWGDFLTPQLRRFPCAYTKVRLRKVLGHGIEGCVARVKFDDDDSRFALKIVSGVSPMQYHLIIEN